MSNNKEKWLYNRKLGIAVLIAAILASVFIGCPVGLNRAYDRLPDTFENGDEEQTGIAHDIRKAAASAADLMAIAGRYEIDPALIEDVRCERETVQDTGRPVSERAAAFNRLYAKTSELYQRLKDRATGSDETSSAVAWGDFTSSYQTAQSNTAYNDAVRSYNDARASFPASLIVPLFGIPAAELFQ